MFIRHAAATATLILLTGLSVQASDVEVTVFPLSSEGHRPQAIAVGPDGNLWVTEVSKHEILRLTPQGVITEFPVPGEGVGVLQGIAAGADGAMWFTSREENSIRRITVTGEFTGTFKIPSQAIPANKMTTGSWPRVIAGTGGGPLWFAEMAANRISSIAVSGAWDLRFPPKWGAPDRVKLDRLVSWTAHPDEGVRHF